MRQDQSATRDLDRLRVVTRRLGALIAERDELILSARSAGASWREIGAASAMTHNGVKYIHRRDMPTVSLHRRATDRAAVE